MRSRFEFTLYTIAAAEAPRGVDATLALMGAQGWEVRAMTRADDGAITFALQRPLGEDVPLPDAPTLAATLSEPLVAPSAEDLHEKN